MDLHGGSRGREEITCTECEHDIAIRVSTTYLPSRVKTGDTELADDSVNDLQAHSSVTFEDPATGCSNASASCFLFFRWLRAFFGDSWGSDGVGSTVSAACADAPPGTVSTATGIAVVNAEVLHAKKLASVYY